ncbi:MAG: universal stress protein [Acidimicrobiaceae bacterium]|nr:universal stress protein [Acidimicrobiaceae bacterium]
MEHRSIQTLPPESIIAIVDDPRSAEPVLRWAQGEAARLGCEALVVFAPAFDELAAHPLTGSALPLAVERVEAVIDRVDGHDPGPLPLVTRPESFSKQLREELVVAKPRLLVVGPGAVPPLAELLFGAYGNGGTPVVLVPQAPAKAARPRGPHRVLTVGFHESAPAVQALSWAVAEAERTDAQVRAVVAWSEDQLGRLSGGMVVSSHRSALPGHTAKRQSADVLQASGVPLERVRSVVVRGSPTAVLVREAARSDLLVVGTSLTRVHEHPVLGATAAGCVEQTPVPIVVVPSDQHRYGQSSRHPASTRSMAAATASSTGPAVSTL